MDPAPSEFERVVLPTELRLIRERRAGAFGEADEIARADPQQVSPLGLAFSGGGIRSATFNLGMIQGLAEKGLLRYVDYLSTVSGGGYIGSWLHGLIRNQAGEDTATGRTVEGAGGTSSAAEKDRARLAEQARQALENAEARLSPRTNPLPGRPDEDPITFLRKYSNYLAPRLGLFSADSWVIGFIWVRNVLLNQLILLSAIASLVALALIAVFMKQVPWRATFQDPWGAGFNWVAGVVAALALFLAGIAMAFSLRFIARQSLSSTRLEGSALQRWLEPRATWIVALVFASIVALGGGYFSPDSPALFRLLVVFCVLIALVIQWGGGFVGCFVGRRGKTPKTFATALFHVAWMSIATGLLAALLVSAIWGVTEGWILSRQAWKQVVFGPPLVALALIAAVMLLVGLMGADYPDAAREWTAKIGALLGTATAAWAIFFVLAVLGPWLVSWLLGNLKSVGISAIAAWMLTTAGGVLAGNSERTQGGSGGKSRVLELLAAIAPTVFLIGYIILVASGVHLALDRHVRPGVIDGMTRPAPAAQYAVKVDTPEGANVEVNVAREEPGWLERAMQPFALFSTRYPGLLVQADREASRLGYLFLLLALFGAVTAIASSRININEFSLHHFYKNRLVRAYLGASKSRQRKPTPLTGFDPLDDFPLSTLTPTPEPAEDGTLRRPYYGPYAIVNAALNLNTGSELAQQERKATSFIFTPAFCGFDPASAREPKKKAWAASARSGYCATLGYAERVGPYLGTTMAISGAAANPNSGYHTSGPMAFLLTVFNARLGWWLGNPRFPGPSRKSGPTFALKYLFAELLGQTTADTKFVNLSDGGHFDNLGLYELVRRRCRFIIVCDSEEDGKLEFGSLGGAIRKCRADFGVEIEINPDRIGLQGEHSGVHCVVGTILYPERETAFRAGLTGTLDDEIDESRLSRGWLLYVKSSLTGDEPADVLEYRSRRHAFPHESTGDQFFSESQFESYRRLGLHVCRTAFDGVALRERGAAAGANDLGGRYPLVSFFQQLAQKWYAPIPISADAASRLADSYVDIMRRLSDTEALKPLFKELQKARLADEAITPELLASGMALMQLVQNVYTEFQLAEPFNRANPKNAGWMQVFREWAASEMLSKRIWPQIKHDYHPLFHEFFEGLARDKEIDVPSRW